MFIVNLYKLDELLEDLWRDELEDVLQQLEEHREEELGPERPQQRHHHVHLMMGQEYRLVFYTLRVRDCTVITEPQSTAVKVPI